MIPSLLYNVGATFFIAGTVFALPRATRSGATVETIYQFPNGTWVENIAVRENDKILVTLLSAPLLYMIDPQEADVVPTLVHNFTEATALYGIAEMQPDVFAVAGGNSTLQGDNTPGSYSIWKVDFSAGTQNAEVSLIAHVPEAQYINGVCILPRHPEILLLGDILGGQVLRLDTNTGKVEVAVPSTNEIVGVPSGAQLMAGVDGIHAMDSTLYVANAGSGVFGRIELHDDGTWDPSLPSTIITHAANRTNFDDFTLAGGGSAYMVTSVGGTIIYVTAEGEQQYVAGDPKTSEIAQPTSVAFSRSKKGPKMLYVSTGGGWMDPIREYEIVGGQVLAIKL